MTIYRCPINLVSERCPIEKDTIELMRDHIFSAHHDLNAIGNRLIELQFQADNPDFDK